MILRVLDRLLRCLNSQSLGVLCQGIKRSKVLAYFCNGLALERSTSDPSEDQIGFE